MIGLRAKQDKILSDIEFLKSFLNVPTKGVNKLLSALTDFGVELTTIFE